MNTESDIFGSLATEQPRITLILLAFCGNSPTLEIDMIVYKSRQMLGKKQIALDVSLTGRILAARHSQFDLPQRRIVYEGDCMECLLCGLSSFFLVIQAVADGSRKSDLRVCAQHVVYMWRIQAGWQ